MIEPSRHLLISRDPPRYFLVPEGRKLGTGKFVVFSMSGDQVAGREGDLRKFEVTPDEAKTWLATQAERRVTAGKKGLGAYAERLKNWLAGMAEEASKAAPALMDDLRAIFSASAPPSQSDQRQAWERAVQATAARHDQPVDEDLAGLVDPLQSYEERVQPSARAADRLEVLAQRVEAAAQIGAQRLRDMASRLATRESPQPGPDPAAETAPELAPAYSAAPAPDPIEPIVIGCAPNESATESPARIIVEPPGPVQPVHIVGVVSANEAAEALANEALAAELLAKEALAAEMLAVEALAKEAIAKEALATERFAAKALAKEALVAEALAADAFAKEAFAKEALARESLAKEALAAEVLTAEALAMEALEKEAIAKETLATERRAAEALAARVLAAETLAIDELAAAVASSSVLQNPEIADSAAPASQGEMPAPTDESSKEPTYDSATRLPPDETEHDFNEAAAVRPARRRARRSPRRTIMRMLGAFLLAAVFLAAGIGILWLLEQYLHVQKESLIITLILLPLAVFLVFSGRLREVTLGPLSAKLDEPVPKQRLTPLDDENKVEAVTQKAQIVLKQEPGKLPKQIAELREGRPPVLCLQTGVRYVRAHLLRYLQDLQAVRGFKFVVVVNAEQQIVGYLPYYVLRSILDDKTPERADAFVALIHRGTEEQIKLYPGVRTAMVTPETTSRTALRRMAVEQIESLLVVNEHRQLVGVVERDQVVVELLLAADA